MYPTRLDMIDPKQEQNCVMSILLSQKITLTSKGTDYVVPKYLPVGEFIWHKQFFIYILYYLYR